MFRSSNFDKLLDKATSNLRLDPDWPTILQICDLIRQNDCSPKYAVAAVKKKLASQNPHQAMFALLVLESIVKNCGSGVHDEVATKSFCEMLRELVKSSPHENLRNKILELIQAWAFAFRNTPKYRAVQDMVNILKAEGHKFPSLKESDAMFSADTAPEWADGEVCHRCRVAFSLMLRRHHCRACGQVFCQQCSSKTSTIPKYGIEKEVRVCDACYEKMNRPQTAPNKLEIVDTSNDYGPAQQQQKRTGKSAEELQEEEELQLALALSQSEAEHKEKERKTRPYVVPEPAPQQPSVSPTPSSVSASPEHSSGNTELSRYLDRSYWEQRLARDTSSAPTAPASHTPAPSDDFTAKGAPSKLPDEEAEDRELDEFVGNLKTQVEIFVNRMKSNSSRGRSIANDSSVQTLFMNITAMHSRLLRFIQQQDDKRVYLESLQDKVTQVRDSRAALDTLRAEHAARLAAAAEAAERQRQMQMAAKLQAMRKKKHEYLQYQRQLALQRVQEQEREMQMRQEQQKHQYMMSSAGFFMPSSVAMHQFQSGYPNQAIYANSQYQTQMLPQATTDTSLPILNQSQMTQANMPLNMNQVGPGPQSMPQISQPYPISTAGIVMSQAGATSQAPLNQSNLRTALGQQLPIQSQIMMQHPMQMRMPIQPGVNPMISQNMTNGLAGQQNLAQPQTQQTSQIPKQGMQTTNALMNQLPMAQQSYGQSNANNNPILSMQMQNMRMPLTQGNQMTTGAQSMPGYTMSHLPNQTNQQTAPPGHSMQQHQQQMSLPGQLPLHSGQQMMTGQPLQNQGASQVIPSNQNLPSQGNQVPSQNQPIQSQIQQMHPQVVQPAPLHGQHIPQPPTITGQTMPIQVAQQLSHSQGVQGQVMSMQGQQAPHSQGQPMPIHSQIPQIVQGQSMPTPSLQSQHMTSQGQPVQTQQHMHVQGQQIQNQGQGSLQAPQMMNQNQPVPNAGQQVSIQGQPITLQQQIPQNQMSTQESNLQHNSQGAPGQPMKIHQQNFAPSTPSQVPNQQIQQVPNQQIQQVPVKSEHNNNTAELISFD